jgi:diguanylate cyclase
MKHFLFYRSYIILVLVIVSLGFLSIFFQSESHLIHVERPSHLNQQWKLEEENGQWIDLPNRLDLPTGKPYTLSKTLNESFNTSQVLLLRSSLSDIKVMVDGQVIYEKTYQKNNPLPPYASMWHFVQLKDNLEGKELQISYQTPYSGMSGVLNEVYYGSHAALYYYLFQTYGIRLFMSLFVFLVGVILMSVSLIFFKKENTNHAYLGLFAIFLSFWMFAESRMLQFFIGNQLIMGSLAYLILPLVPVPLIYYTMKHVATKFKSVYQAWIIGLYALVILIFIFHSTGFMDFFESVIITQIMIILLAVNALILQIIEAIKYKNNRSLGYIQLLIFFSIFLILELINFLFGDFVLTSIFILVGISLSMLYLLFDFIKYLLRRMKISYETEIYEKLAYTDRLTGGFNRHAFEEDFDRYFNNPSKIQQIKFMYFDFDNLKHINDVYGHIEGDKIIQLGHQVIQSTFSEYGRCYRIGGDEFACLIFSIDDETFKQKQNEFLESIQKINLEIPIPMTISFGYSTYEESDMKPGDIIKRADQMMYVVKKSHEKEVIKP